MDDPDHCGGQVRRRRRNTARIGLAAAAAVLVGGGGVRRHAGRQRKRRRSPDRGRRRPSSRTTPSHFGGADRTPLEPGIYRLLVGWDGGSRIQADLTIAGSGWKTGDYPDRAAGRRHGRGRAVYQPSSLAAGSGCMDDETTPVLGDTPQALARQLATLPRSTVVQPPTPTQAFGYDAVHLRLRIADDCPVPGFYRVAMGRLGERGISLQLGRPRRS